MMMLMKFIICPALCFALSTNVFAQRLLSDDSNASSLPDAPTPQPGVMVSTEVAEIPDSLQAGAPAATQTPDDRRGQTEKEISAQEKQRMLGVIPNFNTVMSGEAAPIDSKEKFRLFFRLQLIPFSSLARD